MGQGLAKAFGADKKKINRPQVTETDKAILSLKTQRRKLNEYQRQLQEKIVSAVEKAQACVAKKDKRTALHNLKQKRIFEVRLGEIEKYLMNVEEMLCNIDQARQNNKVFETLRTGNAALQSIQAKVSISALEQLVEDTESAREHEATINAILANEHIDLAEVEDELHNLEVEVEAEQMPDVPEQPVPEVQQTQKEGKAREASERSAAASQKEKALEAEPLPA